MPQREHSGDADHDVVHASQHLVDELDVRVDAAVAVIGSQPELYAVRLATRVGDHGVVYSVDAFDDSAPSAPPPPLPPQVRVRQRTDHHLPLSDQSVDLVLLAFVLRQVAHLRTVLTEIRRILRPGGLIAVADWIRQEETVGPVREERVSAATCERWLASIGFGLIGQKLLNPSHYLVLGRRPMAE